MEVVDSAAAAAVKVYVPLLAVAAVAAIVAVPVAFLIIAATMHEPAAAAVLTI